ncbi:MAG: DUF4157 domain-containing protein [bacterium]|nr:DUF4157 domain-containing protein [bacterium]
MSFETKEKTTDLHPVSSARVEPEKRFFRQPPATRQYRNIGNMAVQRMLEEETVVRQQAAAPAAAMDFSDVNIHTNSSKAPAIGAIAYTQGNDIHFAPGAYNPNSSAGKQLLGHELAHVVQQREGRVQPTTTVNGLPVNDSPTLEKEADAMATKLV